MKLIKRLSQTTGKNGVTEELDILIYEKNIIWYMAETTKSGDGEEFTEDQSYDEYLKNGCPSFVSSLSEEIKEEIDRVIKK